MIETIIEWFRNITFLQIIDFVGTFAFAISGIRLASAKRFDWFGAYVVGAATAIGGGTLRDVMLDVPVFWMHDGFYLACTGFALLWVIIFRKYLIRMHSTFFIFDAIGLALFAVVGIQKTLDAGFPLWVATIMGTFTGAAGGVLRDVFINEIPLIFRKDIYATACIAGGIVYWVIMAMGGNDIFQQICCAATVILLRVLAVKYKWELPRLKLDDNQ